MSLHVTLLYPQWGTRKRLYGVCVRSVLLSGCQAVSAAVRPLCAVGLSGSCQAVTLGPDSDGSPRLSGSAVRLSDTCCQTVRESAVSAVRLSGTVRRCPGFAVRLSDQGSDDHTQLSQLTQAERHRKNSTSSRTVTHTRHPDTAHTRIHALGKAKSVKRPPPTAETRISAHNHFTTLLTETRGSGLLRGPDER